MRYYKMTDVEGNLMAIGTGSGGTEITEEEYAELSAKITHKANLVASLAAGEITDADIREDWRDEIVRRAAAVSVSTDAYTRDALEAMTNADLVTLILALQEDVAP